MTALTTIFLMAQRSGDWGDLIVLLVIVAVSVIGSLGKWIAKQFNEKRQRETQLRRGLQPPVVSAPSPRQVLETAKPLAPRPVASNEAVPPFAAPMPPILRRVIKRIETSSGNEPAMGRVLEMLLEQATGKKIERHAPPAPQPPPVPPAAQRPTVRRSQAPRTRAAPPASPPARTMTIEEREQLKAGQLAQRQTRAERESEEMTSRESQLTREIDQRLGHVGTHVASGRDNARPETEPAEQSDLLERTSLRDALVLSEILAPPLALRDESRLSA